jgi:nucleoid-associated protein YgaU
MKKSLVLFSILCLALSLALDGCTRVRTYTADQERVDQDLTAGNAGYLVGAPSPDELNKVRKMTRQTYVAEVEIGQTPPRSKSRRADGSRKAMAVEAVQEPSGTVMIEEPLASSTSTQAKVTTYVVQNNDTLEKISQKVYGSSKKWRRIYEANQDKLKSPDRIYAGQELKIPQG